jgi:hypothetical protein
MQYGVFGPFEIARTEHGRVTFDSPREGRNFFWRQVDEGKDGLSEACGCYVFALRHGETYTPWYVGKAERMSFRQECSSVGKKYIFDGVLDKKSHSTPTLFLIARTTPSGRLCRRTIFGYRDIRFLEKMLIGQALERNGDLANIMETSLLTEMVVPGVVNSPQRPPTLAERALRKALGLGAA